MRSEAKKNGKNNNNNSRSTNTDSRKKKKCTKIYSRAREYARSVLQSATNEVHTHCTTLARAHTQTYTHTWIQFNVIIMWCSWKVFVCRHDSGDGFIAYTLVVGCCFFFVFFLFPSSHFHRTKSIFEMLHKKHFGSSVQANLHLR